MMRSRQQRAQLSWSLTTAISQISRLASDRNFAALENSWDSHEDSWTNRRSGRPKRDIAYFESGPVNACR